MTRPLAAAAALFIMMTASLAFGQPTAIRFARVWDGTRVIPNAVVVVDNGRILSVEPAGKELPAGARVIDHRRYTGLPGLIDLHTHMTYYWDRQPGTRPLGQRRRPAVTVFLARDNARRTLETGVTTVRDLGASNDTDFAMRDLINLGAMEGGPAGLQAERIKRRRRRPFHGGGRREEPG